MILDKVADYITELMNFDPTRVLIGRENATQETFTNDYIVVDTLSPIINIGSKRSYDKVNEKETFYTLLKTNITFEFYGSNAYTNMFKFVNLQNSQLARDLQKKYEFTIYKTKNINNLKQTFGNKYYERYEVEVMIQFYETQEINTLRIDEVVVDDALVNN